MITIGRIALDLSFEKFESLLAICPTTEREAHTGSVKWFCQCDCGNFVKVSSRKLVHGVTKSCGHSKSNYTDPRYSKNLPNIYIEGPDATGKSTLAEYLQMKHGYKVEHLTGSTPNTFAWHKDLINTRTRTIFDRFCIGEVVYSKIYARTPKISYAQSLTLIKKALDSNGIFILLTTKTPSLLSERLIARGEINSLWEVGLQLWLYRRFSTYKHPNFIVHYIEDGYESLYKKIDEKLKEK